MSGESVEARARRAAVALSSAQNPRIRETVQLLQRAKSRRALGRFVVEGLRECARAVAAGYRPLSLFYREDRLDLEEACALTAGSAAEPLPRHHHCSEAAFARIAYRDQVPNLVTVFEAHTHTLAQLPTPPAASLYLVVDGVEKPGNLGAMLRSAAGLGCDAVLLSEPCAELYHPNTIRNSLGGLFELPIARAERGEVSSWLATKGIQRLVTSLEGAQPPDAVDLRAPSALILGSEAEGVDARWLEEAEARLKIPMVGCVDSLNVSSAAAIFLYEARRQRGWGVA